MATLHLQIVTPEAQSYSDDVDYVLLPGMDGELGVYPGHAALMIQLRPGELSVTKSGEHLNLAVGEGFAEITPKGISVLTDMAIKETEIDEATVEEAIRRAEESLRSESLSDEQQAAFQATLQKSFAQLRVKRRRAL